MNLHLLQINQPGGDEPIFNSATSSKNLFIKKNVLRSVIYSIAILMVNLLFVQTCFSQISPLSAWNNVYHNTGNLSAGYTVPTGSNSNRILVVAVASSLTTAGTRTVTITYGGQTPTASVGDLGSSAIQHTQLYYFNEAKLDAASNSTLAVSFSSGTASMNDVFAAVFDGVDQTNPVTDSKNYNSNTSAVDPFQFATALTVNANDQAVEIISTVLTGNRTARTISSYATNWANVDGEQTGSYNPSGTTNDQGIRNAVANRSQQGTNTTDVSAINLSGTARASMTAYSFKADPPTVAGLSASSICEGASLIITGTNLADASAVTIGGTAASITATSSTSITVTTGSGSGIASTVSVTTPIGTAVSGASVTVNPAPTVAAIAGGASTVCAGITTPAFTDATAGGTWSIINGTGTASIDGGGVVTGGTAGDVTVVYTYSNGTCTNTATTSLTVLAATQPGTISGTTAFCSPNVSTSYSISSVPGASGYTWSVPTGWTIESGQGGTSITVTTGSFGEDGDIEVTATNGCGTSIPRTLAVSVSTVNNIGFNGNTSANTLTICQAITGTTIDGGNPGSTPSYNWQVSTTSPVAGFGNAAGTRNGQNYTIDATYYNTAGTYYFRRVSSSSGCNGNSDVVTLTVNPLPASPGTITGSSSVCEGVTSLSYSIAPAAEATGYTWTVPTGWSITNGQGTTDITVTAGATGQDGNISVIATNACGNSSDPIYSVDINPVSGTNNTGFTDNTNKSSDAITATTTAPEKRGYLKFPLGAIPSGATITGTTVLKLTQSTSTTGGSYNIRPLSTDPVTATASDIFSAIGAWNTSGTGAYTQDGIDGNGTLIAGTNTFNLNASANADIQSSLTTGYIAMGFARCCAASYTFYGYTGSNGAGLNAPVLTVNYTSPRSLAVTINPNSTISLSSSAGTDAQSISAGASINPITYAIGGGGTGADTTGFPQGLAASYNSGTLTISGTPTSIGTFNYTITTNGSGCTEATANGSIIINGGAEATADYQSDGDANFSSAANWKYFNGLAYVPATIPPTAPNGTNNITVLNGDSVTVDVDYAAGAGKTLLVSSGKLAVGSGNTLDVAATGTIDFNDQPVTVKSTSAGTGSIGQILGTLSNATNVTVERYIPQNAYRGWRLLSIPTKSSGQTIHQAWQENQAAKVNGVPNYGTLITTSVAAGYQANGFDTITQGGSVRSYNGSAFVSMANTNTAIETQSGYFLYVRGDRNIPVNLSYTLASSTTLRTNGTLYQGDNSITGLASGKYALIGNIYASEVDFSGISRTGIDNKFYIWDATLGGAAGGAYRTFLSGSPTGGTYVMSGGGISSEFPLMTSNPKIPSGNAFFVHTNSAGAAITLSESNKSGGHTNQAFRPAASTSSLTILSTNLYASDVTNALDGNAVVFDNAYSNTVDANDAIKFSNPGENLGILRDGKTLSIELRQSIAANDTIFLRMWNMQKKNYRLEFSPSNISPVIGATLEDNYLGTSTPIDLSVVNKINFTVDANAGSSAATRFRLVFKQSPPLPVSFTSISANLKAGGVQVDWKVAEERNISKYEVERSANGRSFSNVGTISATGINEYSWLDATALSGSAFYRIKSIGMSGETKYTSIVKVSAGNVKPSITVSPNPVEGSNLNLQFSNEGKGKYNIRLLDVAGRLVFTSYAQHAGGTAIQTLNLPSVIARGSYQLEVIAPDKTKSVQKIIINR